NTVFRFMFFFFQAEDGIRDDLVTGVQTCALPISVYGWSSRVWPPRLSWRSSARRAVAATRGTTTRTRTISGAGSTWCCGYATAQIGRASWRVRAKLDECRQAVHHACSRDLSRENI